jgi:hypothetical protein
VTHASVSGCVLVVDGDGGRACGARVASLEPPCASHAPRQHLTLEHLEHLECRLQRLSADVCP